jgi:hypothetical protein
MQMIGRWWLWGANIVGMSSPSCDAFALLFCFLLKRVKQVKDPTATLWSNIVGLTILTSLLKSRSANKDQPGPFRLAHHGWTQKWAVRAPHGSISHNMREQLVVPPSRSTLSYRSSLQPPAMHNHGQCHVGDNLSSRLQSLPLHGWHSLANHGTASVWR